MKDESNWIVGSIAVVFGVVTVVAILLCLPLFLVLAAVLVGAGKA